jgi:sarcosine oxidase gamma subunit
VLELQRTLAAVVGCYARAEALEALPAAGEALAIRVAPDELMLLGDPDDRARLLASVEQSLLPLDGGGLVLDVSDGFAVWRLRGDWQEAFARLCAVPVREPAACVQALFAHVPAKLVVGSDQLLVVVSSVLSHHVRDRVLGACRDLDPREADAAPLGSGVIEAAV